MGGVYEGKMIERMRLEKVGEVGEMKVEGDELEMIVEMVKEGGEELVVELDMGNDLKVGGIK